MNLLNVLRSTSGGGLRGLKFPIFLFLTLSALRRAEVGVGVTSGGSKK